MICDNNNFTNFVLRFARLRLFCNLNVLVHFLVIILAANDRLTDDLALVLCDTSHICCCASIFGGSLVLKIVVLRPASNLLRY